MLRTNQVIEFSTSLLSNNDDDDMSSLTSSSSSSIRCISSPVVSKWKNMTTYSATIPQILSTKDPQHSPPNRPNEKYALHQASQEKMLKDLTDVLLLIEKPTHKHSCSSPDRAYVNSMVDKILPPSPRRTTFTEAQSPLTKVTISPRKKNEPTEMKTTNIVNQTQVDAKILIPVDDTIPIQPLKPQLKRVNSFIIEKRSISPLSAKSNDVVADDNIQDVSTMIDMESFQKVVCIEEKRNKKRKMEKKCRWRTFTDSDGETRMNFGLDSPTRSLSKSSYSCSIVSSPSTPTNSSNVTIASVSVLIDMITMDDDELMRIILSQGIVPEKGVSYVKASDEIHEKESGCSFPSLATIPAPTSPTKSEKSPIDLLTEAKAKVPILNRMIHRCNNGANSKMKTANSNILFPKKTKAYTDVSDGEELVLNPTDTTVASSTTSLSIHVAHRLDDSDFSENWLNQGIAFRSALLSSLPPPPPSPLLSKSTSFTPPLVFPLQDLRSNENKRNKDKEVVEMPSLLTTNCSKILYQHELTPGGKIASNSSSWDDDGRELLEQKTPLINTVHECSKSLFGELQEPPQLHRVVNNYLSLDFTTGILLGEPPVDEVASLALHEKEPSGEADMITSTPLNDEPGDIKIREHPEDERHDALIHSSNISPPPSSNKDDPKINDSFFSDDWLQMKSSFDFVFEHDLDKKDDFVTNDVDAFGFPTATVAHASTENTVTKPAMEIHPKTHNRFKISPKKDAVSLATSQPIQSFRSQKVSNSSTLEKDKAMSPSSSSMTLKTPTTILHKSPFVIGSKSRPSSLYLENEKASTHILHESSAPPDLIPYVSIPEQSCGDGSMIGVNVTATHDTNISKVRGCVQLQLPHINLPALQKQASQRGTPKTIQERVRSFTSRLFKGSGKHDIKNIKQSDPNTVRKDESLNLLHDRQQSISLHPVSECSNAYDLTTDIAEKSQKCSFTMERDLTSLQSGIEHIDVGVLRDIANIQRHSTTKSRSNPCLQDTPHQPSLFIDVNYVPDLFADSCHLPVANTLENAGRVFFEEGSYDKALAHFEEALCVKRKIYGCTDSMVVAQTLNNIGCARNGVGASFKSVMVLKEALHMIKAITNDKKFLDKDLLQFEAITLKNIGHALFNVEQYSSAACYYQESCTLFKMIHGKYHELCMATLESWTLAKRASLKAADVSKTKVPISSFQIWCIPN